MCSIKEAIETYIGGRYGLLVTVKEPRADREVSDSGILVEKWQVTVETSPAQKDLPRQRIKIEVANIPAYTSEFVPLRMNYPALQGYGSAIFVQTETMNEVMADKVLAFPVCLNYIRYRDIWDIAWLSQQGSALETVLVNNKVKDYKTQNYSDHLKNAITNLPAIVHSKAFYDQMSRFIDAETLLRTIEVPEFKDYLSTTVSGIFTQMLNSLSPKKTSRFRM